MPDRHAVTASVTAALRDVLLVDPPSPTTDLVDSALVDSIGFMELFRMLEAEFGIEIDADDLSLDHFRTVERIASFVIEKQTGARRSPAHGLDTA